MREAAVPGYRLAKARMSTRVLISCGLLGTFLGLVSAIAITLLKTGVRPHVVATYYAGSDAPAGTLEAMTSSLGRPLAELAEVTHLHLMGGSLLLFLLCHLLSLCPVSERLRTGLYLFSFGSFLLTFSIPWAIVFIHRGFAFLFAPSISVLIATLVACCAIPLYEMWFRPNGTPSIESRSGR